MQPSTNTLPIDGYLRIGQVLKLVPVSRSSWYYGIKDGRFPKPHKIGPRTSVWKVEDIRKLIEGGK